MIDCFELLFFHTKMYVLLETGGMILAYLGTLLGLLGRILGPFGGLSGTTLALFSQSWDPFWAFLANVGTISIVATPKRPLWKTPKLRRTLGGTGNWSAPWGGVATNPRPWYTYALTAETRK